MSANRFRVGSLVQSLASWRALGLFWAGLVLTAGVGAGILQFLGPPSRQAVTAEAAPKPEPPSPPPSPPPAPPSRVAGPIPDLLEPSPNFPPAKLPRVGPDGQRARIAYAAPASPTPAGTPRVALLFSGFGLSERDSAAAVDALPGPVSFAVSAYAHAPPTLYDAARANGHELFASIPMEPQGYPANDEGARALLTGAAPGDNLRNLEWALSRTQGAVGVTGASDGMRGERFADTAGAFSPILDDIANRGLLYIDPRPGRAVGRPGLPARAVDIVLDDPPARADIEAKLAALERAARDKGAAIGLAGPLRPNTIERLAAWARALSDRGIALVPVSALVNSTVAPPIKKAESKPE